MAACAWDSASSWVIPQAAQLSRSGTQAMKQPSSSLQKMTISYLLPCSRTTPSFSRPYGGQPSVRQHSARRRGTTHPPNGLFQGQDLIDGS
jgi:hypothetical protein